MDINNTQQITYDCPKCGASKIPAAELTGYDRNLCPYCGHEIIDLSLQKHNEKVNEVVGKTRGLRKIPFKAGIIVSLSLLILFLVLAGIFVFNIDSKGSNFFFSIKPNYYTSRMEKAYKNEDWDKMFDIVILKCDKAISSPWYFAYRSAWFMHEYPSRFDEAVAAGDEDEIYEIYHIIRADYLLRDDFFDTMYESIPEVEEALKAEFERESKIIETIE